MNTQKKNYFRSEANHDEYALKSRACLLMLIASWLYAYWDTIYVTVSLYRYSPAGAHNSLLLIPCIWLLIYEQKFPKFLVPRFNYIGAIILISLIGYWIYATIMQLYGIAHFIVYLMLPAMVIMCMGINIAASNMVPISLWLLSFPMGHWFLQYIPVYLGDVLVTIKNIFEFTTEKSILNLGDKQKKMMYVFWGSIQYLPISFSIVLLYSKYRFKLHLMWQFILLLITSLLTFLMFLVFSVIFSTIAVDNRVYLQTASFATIFLVTITAMWYGHRIHNRFEESGPTVSWFEEGMTVSYSWFRKSLLMSILLLSGPWFVNNINYELNSKNKHTIKAPEHIGDWELQSSGESITGFEVSFINTKQHEILKYKKNNNVIMLYISLNDNSKSDSIVGSYKEFIDKIWNFESKQIRNEPVPNNKDFTVLESVYKNKSRVLVSWSWFYVDEKMAGDIEWVRAIEKVQEIVQSKVHKGGIIVVMQGVNEKTLIDNIRDFTVEFTKAFDKLF